MNSLRHLIVLFVISLPCAVSVPNTIGKESPHPCTRMMTGAEKTAWDTTIWDTSLLLSTVVEYRYISLYTFGYTFGYIGEQCVTGALSAGTVTVSKALAKGGTSLIGKYAPRTLGVLAMRFHYIKEALAHLNLLDDGVRLAYEGMMSSAAREATSPIIKEVPASLMESRMASQGFNRLVYNYKEWIKFAMKDGNIRKLVKIPGRQGQFARACSKWMSLMGDKATAAASKGWVPAYDKLLKFENGNFIEDRAADFFKLMKIATVEGREAARKTLEDYGSQVANDVDAKLWFKDVEKIQAEGYRYSSFDPRFERDGITPVSGLPRLNATDAPEGGWYTSFDKYHATSIAKPSLQIPPNNTARYRLEFDWEAVKNNTRIPRGRNHTAEWFELFAKDYPENGVSGGGAQLVVDGMDVPIKAIWDTSGPIPIQLY